MGQIDPLAPDTHQIHDINPGIAPSGLFWTVAIPKRWVEVDEDALNDGARYQIDDLALLNFPKLADALPAFLPPGTTPTPPVPARASFDLRWMGNTGATSATDAGANRFTYAGIFTHARLGWSASVPSQHFVFRSDPASTSHETFAELVNERNGSFF